MLPMSDADTLARPTTGQAELGGKCVPKRELGNEGKINLFSFPSSCLGTHLESKLCFERPK